MDEMKSQNEVRINNCKRLAAPPLDCGVNFLFRHGYRGVGMTSDRKCSRLLSFQKSLRLAFAGFAKRGVSAKFVSLVTVP